MEAQEAPHNAASSTPSLQNNIPGQSSDPGEQTTLEQSTDQTENEEATIRLTVGQEAQKLLVETETDVAVTVQKDSKTVEGKEKETAKLLVDVKTHETLKVEGAAHILQVAEDDAKHLLREAEEHGTVRVAVAEAKTFAEFWLKFLNDWVLNFSSGLAYNLLMAIFPIVIALGAVIGFISNSDDQQALVARLGAIFPSVLGQNILTPAVVILRKDAGFLSALAIVLALYNGSRLFVAMENYFAVIYHTPTRPLLRQNAMALVMLLFFMLLIPIMLLASSIGLGGFIGGLIAFIVGLIASLLLFQAIYMIVPNQHISLRNSWRGTLIATLALQVYVTIFPLYIKGFLGSYTGNIGFAVILLLFFYYFAVILLIGAEVNAFYAEDVRARPHNIAEMVHLATLEADKAELEELIRQKIKHRSPSH